MAKPAAVDAPDGFMPPDSDDGEPLPSRCLIAPRQTRRSKRRVLRYGDRISISCSCSRCSAGLVDVPIQVAHGDERLAQTIHTHPEIVSKLLDLPSSST